MRTFHSARMRTLLGVAAIISVGTSCADKAFTPPRTAINTHMALRIMTSTAQQVAPTPRYVWVGAGGIIAGGDTTLLGMANALVTGTTQTITLNLDISSCLAANAAKGASGCSIVVGAALRADTIAQSDSSGSDPFMRVFDFTIIGPFDVSSGRAPTIPPIDLSASRFGTFEWVGDNALRLGAAQHGVATGGTPLGRVLTGVTTSGVASPVLYTIAQGVDYAGFQPLSNQPPGVYPALAIFENGTWRRVLATAAPAINTGNTNLQGFMDVTALATNDVYIAATSGLYRYDGASIAKVSQVTDTLYSVGSAPLAGGGRVVVAGGPAGIVWIGYGTSWQKYSTGSSSRFDLVCITSASEAFAASSVGSGATYRFNGSAWVSVPTPSTAPKIDLSCPGPGQAYVSAGNAGFYKWNGGGWSSMGNALPLSRQPHMAATSSSEAYAAGDSAGTDRAFYKFDGNTWTEIGRRRFAQGQLRVWADPRGGAAYVFSAFGRLEKVTPSTITTLSYQPALRDVVMTASNSAVAVGWNMFLSRWDGTKWTVDAPPSGTPSVRILQGVWSDGPSNAWAVGNSSTIVRWGGTAWSLVSDVAKPVASSDNYNAVWGVGGDVWIVGDNSILHCKSAASCTVENSGGGALYSVWGTSSSNLFAVGAAGRILRYNGTSWSAMSSPTGRPLARVAGSGASDVWAVGDSVLVRFDGTQWREIPFTGDLLSARARVPAGFLQNVFQVGLWVRSSKEAYLGGDAGIIVRWDGTRWQQMRDGFFFGRRVMSITGAAGCALAIAEGQSDMPDPTLWRGVGSNGCFAAPMGTPSAWP